MDPSSAPRRRLARDDILDVTPGCHCIPRDDIEAAISSEGEIGGVEHGVPAANGAAVLLTLSWNIDRFSA